jgi:RNA polymerase sigma-70 factor, ECF subfamily
MTSPGALQLLGFPAGSSLDSERLRAAHDHHFTGVWRCLRRLGLTAAEADDTAQQVFVVFAQKIGAVHAGAERSFLYATATRAAADVRRTASRRYEVSSEREHEGNEPPPDVLLAEREARVALDAILEAMPPDLREVFVLYEIEELTMAAIAGALQIPSGTVASRLRRAREEFENRCKEHRAPDGKAQP